MHQTQISKILWSMSISHRSDTFSSDRCWPEGLCCLDNTHEVCVFWLMTKVIICNFYSVPDNSSNHPVQFRLRSHDILWTSRNHRPGHRSFGKFGEFYRRVDLSFHHLLLSSYVTFGRIRYGYLSGVETGIFRQNYSKPWLLMPRFFQDIISNGIST